MTETHPDIISALYEARRDGRALDLEPSPKLSQSEALSAQLAVLRRFVEAGDVAGGWKIGLTSGAGRDAMGVGFRPFGFILESRIRKPGERLSAASILNCTIEPEICLVLGEPLTGENVDATAARRAVRAVAPAFEINEFRARPDMGPDLVLADGLGNWGVVVGEEAPVRDNLAETVVDLWANDAHIGRYQPGASMDDPFVALAAGCRLLHRYGLGFQAGQRVITGSFANHRINGAQTVSASFENLGDVAVEFI